MDVFLDTDQNRSTPVNVFDACFALGLYGPAVALCWTPDRGEVIAAGLEIPLVVFSEVPAENAERQRRI
ncbi:MAG TPA: hypothetical protein VK893_14225, partial [Pyrinomonadaceae bacterium]|nr:hypothetical protein [Pyrinomonadaceae bacterium]